MLVLTLMPIVFTMAVSAIVDTVVVDTIDGDSFDNSIGTVLLLVL